MCNVATRERITTERNKKNVRNVPQDSIEMRLVTPESQMKCLEWLLFMKTVSHVVLTTNHNTGFKLSVINQVTGFKTLCYE